jgi:hypothetical protein
MMAITRHVSVLVAVVLLFLCLHHTHAAVKQSTPVQDPAFVGAGSKAGLLIWRIEVSYIPCTLRSLC